jgi:2-C-methyl-D-erythritol 4-phosphate cytidylyltransferase
MMSGFAVILPAAGQSVRFGDMHYKKPFAPLGPSPVWMHAAERFTQRSDVKQLLLVISEDDREDFRERYGGSAALLGVQIVVGGRQRADSVRNALEKVREDVEYIAVHDAARPCLAESWIDQVFAAARQHGAAILAAPIVGTVKRVNAQQVIAATESREGLWEAQTPQVFRRDWLVEAYAKWPGGAATDDSQMVEQLGKSVHIVPCSRMNLKITTKDDLRLASRILQALPKPQLPGSPPQFG